MTDQVILNLPDEISARAREIAELTSQPFEQVLIDHLQSLSSAAPALPPDVQSELDALNYLSSDALYTIAREHISTEIQQQVDALMQKQSRSTLTDDEREILIQYIDRADRLMLRKAEAALLLQQRGEPFSQEDFKSDDEA